MLVASAAGAQQAQVGTQAPDDTGEASEGGIETRKLEPLTPHGEVRREGLDVSRMELLTPQGEVEPEAEGVVPRGEKFQPAPFRTPEAPVVPERIEPVPTVLKPGARLRQLDKMTGRSETVAVAAGEEAMIDRLRVRLEACRAPDDNAERGTKAFIQVWDTQEPDAPPVFSGWMFAESPALSAMDHARYDLWVMSCTTSSAEASAASE